MKFWYRPPDFTKYCNSHSIYEKGGWKSTKLGVQLAAGMTIWSGYSIVFVNSSDFHGPTGKRRRLEELPRRLRFGCGPGSLFRRPTGRGQGQSRTGKHMTRCDFQWNHGFRWKSIWRYTYVSFSTLDGRVGLFFRGHAGAARVHLDWENIVYY